MDSLFHDSLWCTHSVNDMCQQLLTFLKCVLMSWISHHTPHLCVKYSAVCVCAIFTNTFAKQIASDQKSYARAICFNHSSRSAWGEWVPSWGARRGGRWHPNNAGNSSRWYPCGISWRMMETDCMGVGRLITDPLTKCMCCVLQTYRIFILYVSLSYVMDCSPIVKSRGSVCTKQHVRKHETVWQLVLIWVHRKTSN